MRGKSTIFALCVSASAGALAASQPAIAQSAPDAASSDTELGEIIVTARRSNENLQSVPIAVSVLSGDELAKRRVDGARDLQYNTPSLVVTSDPLGGSNSPVFQLRGQQPAQGSDDTVVTYVGDVPINSRAFSGGLFDLQSVQVIRGPQGTLFGKNSTGGAVIFTPRMADTSTVSGFAEGTVGNYSYYQIGVGLNVPLIEDKLGVRVSGQITRQDGFVRNLSGPDGADKRNEIVKVSLVATPTDELRNETYFSYFHARQHQNPLFTVADSPGLISFVLTSAGVPQETSDAIAGLFHSQVVAQQALGPRTIDYSFGRNNDDNDVYVVTNKTSYDLGFATLSNIFGYYNMHPRVGLSQTSTNFPVVDVTQNKDVHEVSDEIQLAGETPSLKWIVGGFFSREFTRTKQVAYLFGGLASKTNSTDRYTSKALFAQGTYDFSSVGLEGLKFTAGVRHTWDSRVGVLDVRSFSGGGASFIDQPTVRNARSYKNWSWTVGLDYQVSPDFLLYAASRHSYKAGGLNLVSAVAPVQLQTYEPEKLTDVEIGAKATMHLGEATVRANVAAYRGWYKNMQFQELANCGQVASYVVNAAKGSPKGVEFEFDAALTKNFRVSGFYNRTLGKFDSFELVQPNGCVVIGSNVDLNGADFGNISKDTAGLNASYTLPLQGSGEELVLNGGWYMRGKRVGSATQGVNASLPGYSLFNARLDYNNIGGSQFSAGVWVKNLTDKLYAPYRNNVLGLSGYDVRGYGDPQTFGLDVKYKF